MSLKKTAPRDSADWQSIERNYRAGILSTREIAGQHSISHTAINKRAKAEGWDRDLSTKIQAKAEALVSRRMVSAEVSKAAVATERDIIEANAERIAQVRDEHRSDITRMRALVLKLLGECEAASGDPELFAQLRGWRQLSWPPGDNYPGRLEAGNDFLSEAGQRASLGASLRPCCAERRR